MACLASMYVWIPALLRKVADEYFAVRWLLSRTTVTFTPRLCAASRAFAIDADVNEYACTRISFFAFPSSMTTASVAPPWGEKKTSVTCAANGPADTDLVGEEQANVL